MVTEWIIAALVGIVRAVMSLLPEWEPDTSAVTGTAETIASYASVLNGYFPVGALFGVLAFVFAYKVILSAWRLAVRVYELTPLKAT